MHLGMEDGKYSTRAQGEAGYTPRTTNFEVRLQMSDSQTNISDRTSKRLTLFSKAVSHELQGRGGGLYYDSCMQPSALLQSTMLAPTGFKCRVIRNREASSLSSTTGAQSRGRGCHRNIYVTIFLDPHLTIQPNLTRESIDLAGCWRR